MKDTRPELRRIERFRIASLTLGIPTNSQITPHCDLARFFFRDLIGVGFVAGPTPCLGAAVTDALLALHSLSGAFRISRHGFALSRTATAWTLCNTAWSGSGALMWLLPPSSAWFEHAWRFNALMVGVFVGATWMLVRASMDAIGCSRAMSRILLCIALVHGAVVCASTVMPSSCADFEDFIMFSGFSVSLPVQTLILLFGWLTRSHSLLARGHPVGLTVYAGCAFVVAQLSMSLGRGTGPTYWLSCAMPAHLFWEEAATMHVCCLVANEMFYRALAWMATFEPLTVVSPPTLWLHGVLRAKVWLHAE